MAKAVGHFVLYPLMLVLALAHGTAPAQRLDVGNIDVTATSGTLELHRVQAQSGELVSGDDKIKTKGLVFSARTKKDQPIKAEASEGIVVVGGSRAGSSFEKQSLSADDIQSYVRQFLAQATYGDVLLKGDDKPATARIGEEAELESRTIVWSEKYGRVLIPETYRQAADYGGGRIEVTGGALAVNRDFTTFTYFARQEAPIRMVYTADAEQEQSTP